MNLVYPFCHASLWHLLANVWMLLLLVVRCRARGRHLVLAYVVAVSVPSADWGWWSVVGEEPTVGASGMVFALLGMVSLHARRPWRYHLIIALQMALPMLCPWMHVNARLHLYCYLLAIILYGVFRKRVSDF